MIVPQEVAHGAAQGLQLAIDAGTMLGIVGLARAFLTQRNGRSGHASFTEQDRAALNEVRKSLDRLTDRIDRLVDKVIV